MLQVAPGADFEATTAAGTFATGLTGTLGVRITDNEGATTVARVTAGIIETPAGSTIYAVPLTAPTTGGQFSVVWDDGTLYANEDLLVDSRFVAAVGAAGVAYATVEELALLLRVKAVDREPQLQRVLAAAAFEIDQELGLGTSYVSPPPLVVEVNLERAVEHWQQMQSPFGILGLGAESGATHTARDSWDRHAHKLAPLKQVWGLATLIMLVVAAVVA